MQNTSQRQGKSDLLQGQVQPCFRCTGLHSHVPYAMLKACHIHWYYCRGYSCAASGYLHWFSSCFIRYNHPHLSAGLSTGCRLLDWTLRTLLLLGKMHPLSTVAHKNWSFQVCPMSLLVRLAVEVVWQLIDPFLKMEMNWHPPNSKPPVSKSGFKCQTLYSSISYLNSLKFVIMS